MAHEMQQQIPNKIFEQKLASHLLTCPTELDGDDGDPSIPLGSMAMTDHAIIVTRTEQ